ncbi:hypothetical protein B9Z44_11860 [Limnohabitans curvus]|jgi:uncharacterized protein YciI|uniref:YCII-related domain-containing protein n=2 Tax=Limnohabitans curvus TaxID=323423 RepID=A0A315ER34_9BURK|nr:hypothetical protein B9Z44_11860 [Limnohabitans curvus]
MHFVMYCLDVPGSAEIRAKHVEAHKAYLSAAPFKILVSGPLLEDDNETINGSCFLIEAVDKAQLVNFNQNDPFMKAGVWQQVEIRHFAKWRDNR